MKLCEALNINPKYVKRSSWKDWISNDECVQSTYVNLNDLLADDWEVIERTVPVSRSQLADLVNKHIAWEFEHSDKFQEILKELELA